MIQIKTFSPKSHKIKALIYWPSGAGKTVLWWSAENVIFASSEDWLLPLADQKIPFVKIETLPQLKQLRDFLKNEEHEFETLVIDSITDINERIKKSIEEKNWKSMELSMWAELTEKIKWVLSDIKDLDMHIIIIAQEKFEKDWDQIKKIIPSLNWKLSTDICYLMDIVWYIFIDSDWERKLITSPNEKFLSKDRTKRIWNNTELNFKKWVQLVSEMHNDEEEVLYTIMTDTEKNLIERKANFKELKKLIEWSKTIDELIKNFKEIWTWKVTPEDLKKLIKIKDELKETLDPKKTEDVK